MSSPLSQSFFIEIIQYPLNENENHIQQGLSLEYPMSRDSILITGLLATLEYVSWETTAMTYCIRTKPLSQQFPRSLYITSQHHILREMTKIKSRFIHDSSQTGILQGLKFRCEVHCQTFAGETTNQVLQ